MPSALLRPFPVSPCSISHPRSLRAHLRAALADWDANVIDALMEDAASKGSDFQNPHRTKRAMTLNLKEPKASTSSSALSRRPNVVVKDFRPDVETKLVSRLSGYVTCRSVELANKVDYHTLLVWSDLREHRQ